MSENRKFPEMNVPMWFDGKNINEALICEDFLRTHQILFANGAFFTPNGRVTDDLPLRGVIFEELKYCAVNNIPRKISNIIEIMKLATHVEDFPPEQDRIHLVNGTLLLDGTFTEGKPDIVRNRLPIAYKKDAPAPAIWLEFLNGLLYPEDIPTLQEFIGYCLIPSNKGQRMMVIKGNGGEGKSQIGAVLRQMLGSSMKDGSIGKISENRFARADLEQSIRDDKKRVEQQNEMNDGLDAFIALMKKYVDVTELTPTIVNEYIKKIEVFAPGKSSGKRRQKIKIYFNFVDEVDIPVFSEPSIAESTYGRRKNGVTFRSHRLLSLFVAK